MTDEKQETQVSQEETTRQSQAATTSTIEKAEKASERLENASKAMQIENDRREAILARNALGGSSEAGLQAPEKKAETDEEFTKRFESGQVNLLD